MPRVDFYILDTHRNPEHLVCQLTQKACQQGLNITIRTADQATAQAMDDRLWTFGDISFIPHAVYHTHSPDPAPVQITWQDLPPTHRDLLVNLTGAIPDGVENFARIVEIVAADEGSRGGARQRYRDYRERGYELETHNID